MSRGRVKRAIVIIPPCVYVSGAHVPHRCNRGLPRPERKKQDVPGPMPDMSRLIEAPLARPLCFRRASGDRTRRRRIRRAAVLEGHVALSPEEPTVVFAGRFSDLASSSRGVFSAHANDAVPPGSASQQRSCRRLALRSLFTPARLGQPGAGTLANTHVFDYGYSITRPLKVCKNKPLREVGGVFSQECG